jgi:hypothetical protein
LFFEVLCSRPEIWKWQVSRTWWRFHESPVTNHQSLGALASQLPEVSAMQYRSFAYAIVFNGSRLAASLCGE